VRSITGARVRATLPLVPAQPILPVPVRARGPLSPVRVAVVLFLAALLGATMYGARFVLGAELGQRCTHRAYACRDVWRETRVCSPIDVCVGRAP
jgi:hypothetical protein